MLDPQAQLELVNKQIVSLIARIAERHDQIEKLQQEGRSTESAGSLLHFMEAVLLHREHYREALLEQLDVDSIRW